MREIRHDESTSLPPRMPGPMAEQELSDLLTLLYRAQGECWRRGLPAEMFASALGATLALMTAPDSKRVRMTL